jgi:D-galactarolactone cycloisomerase
MLAVRMEGKSPLAISSISGIDSRSQDLIGKATGKPIHKLIGGAFRAELTANATGLYSRT